MFSSLHSSINPMSSLELGNNRNLLRFDSNAAEPNAYSSCKLCPPNTLSSMSPVTLSFTPPSQLFAVFGFSDELDFGAPLMSPMLGDKNDRNRLNSSLIRDLSGSMIIPYSRLKLLDCIGQGL